MAPSLVVLSGGFLPGPVIDACLQDHGTAMASCDVLPVTAGSLATHPAAAVPVYPRVISLATHASPHTREQLAGLQHLLQPGGQLIVQELPGVSMRPPANVDPQAASARAEALQKDLVLGGFVDGTLLPSASGTLAVSASRPKWDLGAKASLPLKKSKKEPAAAKPATWTLSADDDGGDELVDEDALLTEADKARPAAAPAKESDCEVGAGRKACKNCTCGRAEAEAAGAPPVKLTQEMLDNPQAGGCGSCALGDAFRCAGCPYRGLPSFEAGKKIELPKGFLTADA